MAPSIARTYVILAIACLCFLKTLKKKEGSQNIHPYTYIHITLCAFVLLQILGNKSREEWGYETGDLFSSI
jgi:hypothetical protein